MIAGLTRADLWAVSASVALCAVALLLPATVHGAELTLPALLSAMIVWIAVQDAARFTIPDGAVIVVALIAAAMRFSLAEAWLDVPALSLSILLDALLCGGVLWGVREIYFRYRGVDGLGFGDVKLAAAAGILVGWEAFAWALLVASLSAVLIVMLVAIVRSGRQIERLPFGAFLAPACLGLWWLQAGGIRW